MSLSPALLERGVGCRLASSLPSKHNKDIKKPNTHTQTMNHGQLLCATDSDSTLRRCVSWSKGADVPSDRDVLPRQIPQTHMVSTRLQFILKIMLVKFSSILHTIIIQIMCTLSKITASCIHVIPKLHNNQNRSNNKLYTDIYVSQYMLVYLFSAVCSGITCVRFVLCFLYVI